jgi:hypothetical protein
VPGAFDPTVTSDILVPSTLRYKEKLTAVISYPFS